MQTTLWTARGDVPAIVASYNNLTAAVDPTAANDVSQNYSVGSVWYNSAAGFLRWWTCVSNAVGAAVWVFTGAAYASGGTAPNVAQVQFGTGTGLLAAAGNINRQVVGAGINPGATAADNVLAIYSLPAGSFDVSGRGITLTAQGSFAANGNTKRIKLIFNATTAVVGSTVTGGTTIADSGAVTTNGGGWSLQANVFKYGAAGSNTQLGLHQQAQVGAAVAAMLAPTLITATESGAILIAVTGNAATTATDIAFNFLEINAMS
jgi:hypothetical protein